MYLCLPTSEKSMIEKRIIDKIYDALNDNRLEDAQYLVHSAFEKSKPDATLFYLQGKIFMKRSQCSLSINSFLKSEELEPNGPARECLYMLNDIMNFYNKDMYNQ